MEQMQKQYHVHYSPAKDCVFMRLHLHGSCSNT